MADRLTTMELRQRLGEVLDRVALRHDRFLVERKGRALAALVPVEMLEQLEGAARRLLSDPQARTGITQAEADAVADEAKHETRPR